MTPIANRLVVFGGRSSAGDLNDLFALDLATMVWSKLTPAAPLPDLRSTHNAVYDPGAHQMLVWSGRFGGVFYNDVWALDLATDSWSKFALHNPRPNTRYGTGAIFDPMANRLVTFAGFTEEGRFDDTWAFAPTTATWTNLGLVANPGRRCLHTASYDPGEHRMIIYGGQRSGELGDLWALDLDTHVWTEFTPAASPQGRTFPASVYDAHGQRFIIFGGVGTKVRFNDVWALEGLAPAPPPTAVEAASWGTVKAERKNTPRNIPAND